MRFVYPYETERDGDSVIVLFPDVPGALTQVDRDEDFNELTRDCLVAALGGYVETRLVPPRPSPCVGRPTVTLDVLTSAKLALASAVFKAEMTNSALAIALNVSEKVIRRLLDLDHVSRMDRLESALAYFGRELVVTVRSQPDFNTPALQMPGP